MADQKDKAARLGRALMARNWFLATAESCTGGLLAGALTEVAGSSEWFLGGVVAYANSVKQGLLGVPAEVLAANGAVSEQTVLAMAEGVRRLTGAQLSVSVSGVAGPGGGTPDKPVGLVWMAWAWPGGSRAGRFDFQGPRARIREQAVSAALDGLLAAAGD
ncbi:MAG: CinA family protein [Desulfovibrionaceae bacterium]|nr:CinA family protein [Desulfovibrionaceae bacterium]